VELMELADLLKRVELVTVIELVLLVCGDADFKNKFIGDMVYF
jgi:hypothetical protein